MARVAFALLMALALAAPLAASAYETEEGVIVGTDETLDEIVADNEFVLVEFYAPWCGHCKSLAPEYAQAAQELESKGSPVKLVKVDATIHSKSAERFGVQGYPTLKWFTNGEASDFGGGRTASEIVNWVNKKSGPPAVDVEDVAAAKALAEENDVVVLGVFDDKESDDAKVFLAAAADTDLPFGISTSADVAKEFGLTVPGVIVLKDFDNGNTIYDGEMDADDISAFAIAESLPLVIEFNDQNAPKIFGGEVKTHLLLFAKESDENTQAARDAMAEAAADFKGAILFIYMNSEKEEHERIMDFFGIQSGEIPTMRLIALEDNMAKYKPDFTDITAANIKGFAKKFVAGELERHLMSEETPEDWDAEPVKVLTGNNFKSVALAEDKAVLVEFYAPWCGHCKSLAPIYDKLGAAFEGADEIVIAKMDSTANEVAGVTVESFPTIKFFPKGVTSPEGAVDYEGARTLKAMADFITEKTGVATEVADDGEEGEEGGEDYGDEPEYEEDAEEGHDEL